MFYKHTFLVLYEVFALPHFTVTLICIHMQVEGDTVTFSFEMRSGREHNTPDKAMWGFHVTVRAQVLQNFYIIVLVTILVDMHFCSE